MFTRAHLSNDLELYSDFIYHFRLFSCMGKVDYNIIKIFPKPHINAISTRTCKSNEYDMNLDFTK